MARDIEPVDAGKSSVSGRLCNFPTGSPFLTPTHKIWLDEMVIPALHSSPNPWIDIFGYASRLGDYEFNKQLSYQRCEAVVRYVRAAVPNVPFPQEFGFGESKSDGAGVAENDGFWRAVELYVYANGKPPKRKLPPPEPRIVDEWFVTKFSGKSESAIVVLGYSAMMGQITFQRADGTKYSGAIGLFGLSAGLSLDIGKLPGMSTALKRFPALLKWLGGGGASEANELLKWVIKPGTLQYIINRTPGGMALYNLLLQILGGGSVSPSWAPSTAIGLVFPFHPPLSTLSFYGDCLCYGLSGTVAVGTAGTYILFFGYRGNMYSPSFSLDNFRGCAIISAAGASLQIPGLSAAGTIYVGEIT